MNDVFEIIMTFIAPLKPALTDPDITDIMVNPSGSVFVEREGQLESLAGVRVSPKNLMVAIQTVARRLGEDISDKRPILDSTLPDGSRVAAVASPCSVGGMALSIRKFTACHFTMEDLIERGTVTRDLAGILERAVKDHKNILVSGQTGSGKTTVINILAKFIDRSERVLVVEDVTELQLELDNLVRLVARRGQDGLEEVTIRSLLKACLRHRPSRLIVGEFRSAEAFDLLQAMNTGTRGIMASVHANSAFDTLSRFETCVAMAGVSLPPKAVRSMIGSSVDVVVHMDRRGPQRLVTDAIQVEGYDSDHDRFETRSIV